MAMGAGLGFPVGVSAPLRFHPQPPIEKNVKRSAAEQHWVLEPMLEFAA